MSRVTYFKIHDSDSDSKGVRSPGIYVYIYGEKIYVYIYFLGSFGNLASLGSRMENGNFMVNGPHKPLPDDSDSSHGS